MYKAVSGITQRPKLGTLTLQVLAVKPMAEMNQGNEPPEHYLGRGKDGLLTYI